MNYYLYVIACGTHVKIGISNNPERRLKQIATYCPVEPRIYAKYGPTTQGQAAEAEWYLHKTFADRRSYREWFSLTSRELKTIDYDMRDGGVNEPRGYWREMYEYIEDMTAIGRAEGVISG